MHRLITISGSMRYWEEILHHATKLSIEGNIVLIPFKDPDEANLPKSRKNMYDEVHNERIEISDELFVVNKDGYIGNDTRREIIHAFRNDKNVEFLERPSVEYIGNLLLGLTHFQRIEVLNQRFQMLMENLLSSIYYHHFLSNIGKYDFVTSSMDIHKFQTELDLLFEVTRHCMNVNNVEISPDTMYQPALDDIFDNIANIVDTKINKSEGGKKYDLEISDEIPWDMSELLYSTSSELLDKLDK